MIYRDIILKQVCEDGFSGIVSLLDAISDEDLVSNYGPREEADDWSDYEQEDED